jgi:hypothetical protein
MFDLLFGFPRGESVAYFKLRKQRKNGTNISRLNKNMI